MRELFFAYLATRAEYAKPKSCRTKLVGPMRAFLWRHGGAQEKMLADMWPDVPPHARALIADRKGASDMLADFCARCGRCAWSKQCGVMISPPGPGGPSRLDSNLADTDPGEDHGR